MQNGRPDFPDAIEAAGDCPKGGRHEPFDTPPDPDGRPVDTELLGAFMGAAMEVPVGCRPCQARLLDDIAGSPDTAARLVEVAAMLFSDAFGGVPSSMTSPVGVVTAELARLTTAGVDGQNLAMYALAHAMSRAELRVAVSNAADLIVGMLALFGVVGDGT